MLTSTINNATPTPSTTPAKQNDLGQKDIFLKLLVAQMQYQNPLKPQDPTKMTTQLAQFNMVEQQTQSNTLLKDLVANSSAGTKAQANSGASYLGRTATVNQNTLNFNNTPQHFSAQLDQPASTALIVLTDSNGNPVRHINLSNLSAGANPLTWDGTTDSGATAAAGIYTVDMQATDINGSTVANHIQQTGIVDAVRFTSTGTEFMVGGVPSSITDITEIRL